MWELIEAITLIRKLQPVAHSCGYCLMLGGGVLNTGTSNHDLDVGCHMMTNEMKPRPQGLMEKIEQVTPLRRIGSVQRGYHALILFQDPLDSDKVFELWFLHHYVDPCDYVTPYYVPVV